MANAKISSVIGVQTDDVSTTPKFSLGTVASGDDGVFQYVQAGAAISAADSEASRFAVAINSAYSAVLMTTALAISGRRVGIAPAITIPSGSYFWARVSGTGRVRVAASAAAGSSLRTTTAAGRLGTASTVSAVLYPGLVLVTAASASGASAGSTTRPCIFVQNAPSRQSSIGMGAV